MKTINHECYVSLEVAKLLKEAGFDWNLDVDFVYADIDKKIQFLSYIYVINNYIASNIKPDCGLIDRKKYKCCYLAPTLDVAQRWLREVKNIEVNVLCVYIEHIKKYSYTVFTNEYEHEIIDEGFDAYEEAQEVGIKKALEMILEKGE